VLSSPDTYEDARFFLSGKAARRQFLMAFGERYPHHGRVQGLAWHGNPHAIWTWDSKWWISIFFVFRMQKITF